MENRLATTDMIRKLRVGVLCPFFAGGELGPHLVQCGLYIHTKWHLDLCSRLPQYTNVTDRQDSGAIAYGEPFYKRSPKNHVSHEIFCTCYLCRGSVLL